MHWYKSFHINQKPGIAALNKKGLLVYWGCQIDLISFLSFPSRMTLDKFLAYHGLLSYFVKNH